MRIRSLLVIAVACVLGLTVSACSAKGAVVRRGDVVVLVGAEGDGDNIAGIRFGGQVSLVGACVGIDQVTVIWPHGTEILDEDPVRIEVPGLGQVKVGDRVDGGGDILADDHRPTGIDEIPSDCSTSEEIIAFFPDS